MARKSVKRFMRMRTRTYPHETLKSMRGVHFITLLQWEAPGGASLKINFGVHNDLAKTQVSVLLSVQMEVAY